MIKRTKTGSQEKKSVHINNLKRNKRGLMLKRPKANRVYYFVTLDLSLIDLRGAVILIFSHLDVLFDSVASLSVEPGNQAFD